jgi:hypothetical protein
MAKAPEGFASGDPNLYVGARRILLDALDALATHCDSVVLIGAQAVYLRSESAATTASAFTSDADLSLDPRTIGDTPLLEDAMTNGGFTLAYRNQPGIWQRKTSVGGHDEVGIQVDLLVPERFAGRGRRSAEVPPHGRTAVRRVEGIEATLVDNAPMLIGSLEPHVDMRVCEIKVSGVAALLIAKAFKIRDRLQNPRPGRDADKDAGDVIRMMQTSDVADVVATMRVLTDDPEIGAVCRTGLGLLRDQFAAARTPGTVMAERALAGGVRPGLVRQLAPAFVRELSRSG